MFMLEIKKYVHTRYYCLDIVRSNEVNGGDGDGLENETEEEMYSIHSKVDTSL